MPTTSNFGWTTPADTDLVKDGAAAIRTLGNGIDTSLVDLKGGTTGQVLSKASNTDLDYTWVTTDDANAIQNSIVDAKGDLIAATANDTPARLAVGTNGQYLKADSTAATGLAWATLPASGKVLQVVGAANSTEVSNSTSTYADTNTTATITPTSATSKILVIVMQGGLYKDAGNSENQIQLRLLRGASEIGTTYNNYTQSALRLTTTSGILMKLDEPATTSATTYKTQFKCVNNTASVAVQINGSLSSIVLMEIGA